MNKYIIKLKLRVGQKLGSVFVVYETRLVIINFLHKDCFWLCCHGCHSRAYFLFVKISFSLLTIEQYILYLIYFALSNL